MVSKCDKHWRHQNDSYCAEGKRKKGKKSYLTCSDFFVFLHLIFLIRTRWKNVEKEWIKFAKQQLERSQAKIRRAFVSSTFSPVHSSISTFFTHNSHHPMFDTRMKGNQESMRNDNFYIHDYVKIEILRLWERLHGTVGMFVNQSIVFNMRAPHLANWNQ